MKNFSKFAFLIALVSFSCQKNTTQTSTDSTKTVMVGNDADAHGCKSSAGYTWSVVKNKCIRIFEEGVRLEVKEASLDKTLSAFAVIADDDKKAEIFLPTAKESVLLSQVSDSGAGTWKNDSLTLSQWKGMYTLEKNKKTMYQGHK